MKPMGLDQRIQQMDNNNPEGNLITEPFLAFWISVGLFSFSVFLLERFCFPYKYDKNTGCTHSSKTDS